MNEVSVIIPNYNRSSDLIQAVESVLCQTYPVLEVLVCDDGSTDNSKEYIERLNDPRVKWLDCGRNGRPAIPRNHGIKQAQGEWLAFLDNDDWWAPEKLEIQIHHMREQRLHASTTNALRVDNNNQELGLMHNVLLPSVLEWKDILPANWVICSSAVVHRSIMQQVGGFPESPHLKALEDYACWLRVASFTSFVYINQPLVRYKDAPTQSIRSADVDKWSQREKVFDDYYRWSLDHNVANSKTKSALKAVRHAMRQKGINLWERLKYR